MKKAAIDIGTNSTRLLVAEVGPVSYQTVVRQAQVTRLGEGVNETKTINWSAMDRTIKTLMIYKGIIDSYGFMAVNVASTSAARDAKNISQFSRMVKQETGLELKVITTKEEAENAFLGATYILDPEVTYLVIDIGGGSTELILGSNRRDEKYYSKDIGCVRLFEKFITDDPPGAGQLDNLTAYVRNIFSEAVGEIKACEPYELVGTAGTVTSLSAIAQQLKVYDPNVVHHSVLTLKKAKEICKQLAGMTIDERKKIPTMEPGREDVVIAGSLILTTLMEMLGKDSILVSETDILDGLMLNA